MTVLASESAWISEPTRDANGDPAATPAASEPPAEHWANTRAAAITAHAAPASRLTAGIRVPQPVSVGPRPVMVRNGTRARASGCNFNGGPPTSQRPPPLRLPELPR